MQIEQGNTNDDVYAFENVVKKFVLKLIKIRQLLPHSVTTAHILQAIILHLIGKMPKKMGVVSQMFYNNGRPIWKFICDNLTLDNRTFHVAVQADTTFRALVSDMNKYYVRNQRGQMVPLSTL